MTQRSCLSPTESFDAVINVESSGAYPHFSRFLAEVARVLRPGGDFLYADLRPRESIAEWEATLSGAPMRMVSQEDINAQVLRGMEKNTPPILDLIDRVPRYLRRIAREYVGLKARRSIARRRAGSFPSGCTPADRSVRSCLATVNTAIAPDYHCVIVGAGFSGIGAAVKLDKAGLHDYLIIEAGDEPGGTWYWNTYPGIAVDIPSFSYQFSFEQSPNWSRTYASGDEVKAYAEHCVDKYGLRSKIRFNTKVLGADFDDETDSWRIRIDPGGVGHGEIPRQRLWRDDHAEVPRHRRGRFVRRSDHAHRALGPRPGSDRQARRRHRHRRIRRAGHSRHRANRRASQGLSAHADLVLPQIRRAAAPRCALGDAVARRQSQSSA